MVDYYSHDTEVSVMTKNKKESEVVRAYKTFLLDRRFALVTALPSTAVSMHNLQIIENLKSPQAAQKLGTNGEAKRSVQTAKSILKEEKDQANALIAYRSTPLSCHY